MPRRRGVIGLGNPDRGDDIVGILVIRALRGRVPEDVALLEDSGAPLFVLEQFQKFDALILVDAVRSGSPPSAVHCFDGRQIPPGVRARTISSHGMCVHDALGLGEALGLLPEIVRVVGIEAADFTPGAPMTAETERAVPAAVEAVLREIAAIALS
jgi:hydrogenase maturation protease